MDGQTLAPAQSFTADTELVGLGQRHDVVKRARHSGRWPIHCHIPQHGCNNNIEMQAGGTSMAVPGGKERHARTHD